MFQFPQFDRVASQFAKGKLAIDSMVDGQIIKRLDVELLVAGTNVPEDQSCVPQAASYEPRAITAECQTLGVT
jgi:hypothetical protein